MTKNSISVFSCSFHWVLTVSVFIVVCSFVDSIDICWRNSGEWRGINWEDLIAATIFYPNQVISRINLTQMGTSSMAFAEAFVANIARKKSFMKIRMVFTPSVCAYYIRTIVRRSLSILYSFFFSLQGPPQTTAALIDMAAFSQPHMKLLTCAVSVCAVTFVGIRYRAYRGDQKIIIIIIYNATFTANTLIFRQTHVFLFIFSKTHCST